MYNWQHKNWPEFKFDSSSIDNELMKFMLKAGELKGIISALPESISTETVSYTHLTLPTILRV